MNGCNDLLEQVETFSASPVGTASERELVSTRIWLVDDNSAFRVLLASILNDEPGFECERHFSSPAGVLKALAQGEAPDIILLDIQMGAFNGLDAVQPIKALAPKTHVLMLTTFLTPDSRVRAFRDGASDFMLKTWPIAEITRHIRQAMEFGSVAGLLTAFLGQGRAVEKPVETKEIRLKEKTSGAERWLSYMRGLLKFSPS